MDFQKKHPMFLRHQMFVYVLPHTQDINPINHQKGFW